MLGEAISYPKDGEAGWKTVGIGGVLLFPLIAIFIIPALIAQGYLVRTVAASIRGEDAPAFDDWGNLLVDGIKLFVVGLVYFFVPFVLYVAGLVMIFSSVPADPRTGASIGSVGATGVALFLLSFLLFIVIGYFAPAGVANFAYKDRFGAAFSFGKVFDTALDSDYFVALLLVILLNVGFGILVLVLTLLTLGVFYLVFILLGSFVQFYLQVAFMYLVGRGYARSRDLSTGPAGSPDPDVPTDPQLE